MNNLQGIKLLQSPFPVEETVNRLVILLQQHGAIIYARINQQTELASIGQRIEPIETLLFGSPKNGGPLMAFNPLTALELPLKILTWEDDNQMVWIAFNDADYIKERYQIPEALTSLLDLMPVITKALWKK